MTDSMHELVLISAEVHHYVASGWILYDKVDQRHFNSLSATAEMLSRIAAKSSYISNNPNGAQFAVSHLSKVASILKSVVASIVMINKERNLTIEIRKGDYLVRRLDAIHEAIEAVGDSAIKKVMPR